MSSVARQVVSIGHLVLSLGGLDHQQGKGTSMDGGKVHLSERKAIQLAPEQWKAVSSSSKPV